MAKPKAKAQFSLGDIGKLYTTTGKDVWRLSEYIPEPWVTMDLLQDPGERKTGLESQFVDFVQLIPAVDPPKREKRRYHRKGNVAPQSTNSSAFVGTPDISG